MVIIKTQKWIARLLFIVTSLGINALYAKDEYKLVTIEDKEINSEAMHYDGTLIPRKLTEMISPGEVVVKKKHFNFGDRVNKDQLLYELSSPELQLQYATAKMELLEHQEQFESLKNWQSGTEVLKAKNNIHRAKQNVSQAKERYLQTKKLFDAGIVSKEEYLLDKRIYEENQQNFENAKQYLQETKDKVTTHSLALAQMRLSHSQNQVQTLAKKISLLTMQSPVTGVIFPGSKQEGKESWTNEHQSAFQSSQVLAVIAEVDSLYISIKVDEFDIIKISKGLSAHIKLSAFPRITLTGKVDEINIKSNKIKESKEPASFEVKILLDQIPPLIKDKLLLGMSATVQFERVTKRGLFVPKEALLFEEGKFYVGLCSNNQKITKKQVEIGEIIENYVIIQQGVKSGDQVVLYR